MRKWRVAGINFDHMHMGDNLRMAFEHPNAELVGLCDEQPARMQSAIRSDQVFAAIGDQMCVKRGQRIDAVRAGTRLRPVRPRHGPCAARLPTISAR